MSPISRWPTSATAAPTFPRRRVGAADARPFAGRGADPPGQARARAGGRASAAIDITRALGIEPEVEVDTWTYPMRAGDVVLLCSDGLTSMISEPQIAAVLAEQPDWSGPGNRLIGEANEAGGRDNITVVLFRLEDVMPGRRAPLTEESTAVDWNRFALRMSGWSTRGAERGRGRPGHACAPGARRPAMAVPPVPAPQPGTWANRARSTARANPGRAAPGRTRAWSQPQVQADGGAHVAAWSCCCWSVVPVTWRPTAVLHRHQRRWTRHALQRPAVRLPRDPVLGAELRLGAAGVAGPGSAARANCSTTTCDRKTTRSP